MAKLGHDGSAVLDEHEVDGGCRAGNVGSGSARARPGIATGLAQCDESGRDSRGAVDWSRVSSAKTLARGLVAEDPRFGGRGRPGFLISTTAFLQYFGLSSLNNLPPRALADLVDHAGQLAEAREQLRVLSAPSPKRPFSRDSDGVSVEPARTGHSAAAQALVGVHTALPPGFTGASEAVRSFQVGGVGVAIRQAQDRAACCPAGAVLLSSERRPRFSPEKGPRAVATNMVVGCRGARQAPRWFRC